MRRVENFFWPDAVSEEQSEFSIGREDCMKFNVQEGSSYTDTCSRYFRALCMIKC